MVSSMIQSRLPQNITSKTKHGLHCLLLLSIIGIFVYQLSWTNYESAVIQVDPVKAYGHFWSFILYAFRFLALLALPQCFCNFLGLTLYNAFPDKVQIKKSPLITPLLCIRTVTRGDFPDLVKNNVNRNMNTIMDVGIENFMIEVVTDKLIETLPKHPRIRQVVVPSDYQTKTGALFKVSS